MLAIGITMKKIITVIFFLTIINLNLYQVCNAEESKVSDEPTTHDKIYFFQHTLLPKWTHNSNGRFFDEFMHLLLGQTPINFRY